jgi:hypothetical protein
VPYLAHGKRLGNRERPVPEVRLGSEELDGDTILRERTQRQRGFESGDASTGDQDVRSVAAIHDVSSRGFRA